MIKDTLCGDKMRYLSCFFTYTIYIQSSQSFSETTLYLHEFYHFLHFCAVMNILRIIPAHRPSNGCKIHQNNDISNIIGLLYSTTFSFKRTAYKRKRSVVYRSKICSILLTCLMTKSKAKFGSQGS